MARKRRIEKIGFYHIVNRGVERRTIFYDSEDYLKFLDILDDSANTYNFSLFSFALMNNHYHLLIQTTGMNLSMIMRQINSRYSIYFNNKYKRVGPLWQGRFKSWYVYDEKYLNTLVRYIEFNPIKANITKKIGEFHWAMSSKNISLACLDYKLIDIVDFKKEPNEKDKKDIDKLFNAKLELKDDKLIKKSKKDIQEYFRSDNREIAIANAIKDDFLQVDIANFLGLSNIAISKIYKIYRQKLKLFDKLKTKGIFWSFSKDIIYSDMKTNVFIEYILKYGDFDDITLGLKLFGKKLSKKVWKEKLVSDQRFIKTNLMIARVFFKMNIESDYFKGKKNERLQKLKLFAS